LAGLLRRPTAQVGLSLGDRFCLAPAKQKGMSAWTADKVWKRIAGTAGVDVVTIG
jgi:PIN domain nuclease of toxin-antitoxin system